MNGRVAVYNSVCECVRVCGVHAVYLRCVGGEVGATAVLAPRLGPLGMVSEGARLDEEAAELSRERRVAGTDRGELGDWRQRRPDENDIILRPTEISLCTDAVAPRG
eukprot:GHVU01153872.1.p1 GENE.GHVU01153872.1~~GHVU01153872.1.p1  ORF type:complete len:107 (-),score=5.73 GHVU01153872.1:87-407(-)